MPQRNCYRRTWRTSFLQALTVYSRFPCRSEVPGCEGELLLDGLWLWFDRGDYTLNVFERCDWCGRNRIRIYRRSEREKNKPPVEERRSREDISIGHELFSETSLFPSSVVSLYPRLVPFPPTEEHCHCGSGAKGKSVSLYVPSASLLSSSISVWLSVSLSSFLKCCFFKVSPNNSALELYLASLFMFTWTVWVLWIKVLVSGRQRLLIFLYFFWLSIDKVVRTTIMVVPG